MKKILIILASLCVGFAIWMLVKVALGFQLGTSNYIWLGIFGLIQSIHLLVVYYNLEIDYPNEKDEHVYCFDCLNGQDLLNSIMLNSKTIPKDCDECYPWNPEDSFPLSERTKYQEINN